VNDIIVEFPTNRTRRQAFKRALRRHLTTLVTLETVVFVNLVADALPRPVPLGILSAVVVAVVAIASREAEAQRTADVDRFGAVFVAEETEQVLEHFMLATEKTGPGWKPAVTIRELATEIAGDVLGRQVLTIGSRSRQLQRELLDLRTRFLAAAGQTGDLRVRRIALAFAADLGHASTDAIALHVNLDILKSRRQEPSAAAHEMSELERVSIEAYRKLGERLAKTVQDGEALRRLVSER
jgi:hypothetical protein